MAITSLFGPTPAEIIMSQQKEAQQEQLLRNQMIAQQGAEFGPFRGLYQAGLKFGDVGAQALTQSMFPQQVDPRLQEATAIQSVLSKYAGEDQSDPNVLARIGKDLMPVAPNAGLKALTLAQQLQKESVFGKIDPSKVTPASLEVFQRTKNITDLRYKDEEPKTERERTISLLNRIETDIAAGNPISKSDLNAANIAIQFLEKPTISVDPASGAVTRIDPINVAKAFPNARSAAFGLQQQQGGQPTTAKPSEGPGTVTSPAPGVTLIQGQGKPLSDEQFKGLQGGFNMLQSLKVVENNKDLFGLLKGPSARTAAVFGMGEIGKRAADTEAALGSIKTNVSSLIKGIPSNFDVQTFFGRIPNLNGLLSLESEQKALAKLNNLNDETKFLVRSAIAYYKKNKNSIPPEFEEIAKGYGIDLQSIKPEEYTPNLQEAFDKKFNVYTTDQENLIQKTIDANKAKGMDRTTAIQFLKSRGRL